MSPAESSFRVVDRAEDWTTAVRRLATHSSEVIVRTAAQLPEHVAVEIPDALLTMPGMYLLGWVDEPPQHRWNSGDRAAA